MAASTKGKGNASQKIAYPTQLSNEKKDQAEFNWENAKKSIVGEEKSKGINFSNDMTFTNKPKASDIAVVLPSTSMAAHATVEDVEIVETEKMLEVAGNATRRAEKGTPSGIPEYHFLPPPPPRPRGASLQVSSSGTGSYLACKCMCLISMMMQMDLMKIHWRWILIIILINVLPL